ncbi:hypothetical protein IFR04_014609 [Cadophora malorum]|uniref:LysM domain-containing protein n=1 Tax=Cadophora malorum TaxID=108018 RepID=A0A8H7T0H6_9HELO|nr:hypothetical protein IFR04_014609 [Cadophora malorum]
MKVFTSIYQVALLSAAALILLITIVSATPFEALDTDGLDLIPAPSIPEGYTEGELHMTGTFADGIAINHTGTVEQIFAKLAVENPHINFTELALATPNVKPIEKKSPQGNTKSDLNCIPVSGQNWYPAKDWAIINGIDYLQKVNAACGVGANKCARVSCSYNSGIHLCNNLANLWDLHDRIPSREASLAPGLPRSLRASVRTADTVLTHMVLTWLVDNFGISRTTTFVFTRRSVKGNDDCYTQSLPFWFALGIWAVDCSDKNALAEVA